jgi:hypothetical protein
MIIKCPPSNKRSSSTLIDAEIADTDKTFFKKESYPVPTVSN